VKVKAMKGIDLSILGLALILWTVSTEAQQPLVSPQVHPDKRVTFFLRAPNAQNVLLSREGGAQIAMQKNAEGVWSVTTDPMEPDIYGYAFVADGVSLFDPSNPFVKMNLLYTQSLLHVPGPASLPWEVNDVPHGVVHHHRYTSTVVGDKRDFYVYTPPGYDPKSETAYPVLYLLHGFSDDASAWTVVGRAEVILDNLIAEGKAKPMLLVMPLGYGAPEIVARTSQGLRDRDIRDRNYTKFREAMFAEVMPEVEKTYRVRTDRDSRAIAGLSMGGAESLLTGLNALDRFAWIAAFSSGGIDENFEAMFPKLTSEANKQLRLLWIACGKEDHLIDLNRKLNNWLDSKEIRHTQIETAGAHTWMVWRRNLATLAPLLFQ
jgi:enterochelin esterase family protein